LYNKIPELQLLTKSARLESVHEIVDKTIDFIKNSLKEGRSIEIRGFGIFRKVKRKGKKGRRVKTGEVVNFGDFFDIKFKTSKLFKRDLNKKNDNGEK